MAKIVKKEKRLSKIFKLAAGVGLSLLVAQGSQAGPREQAKRIHDRLAGVPPTAATLDAMEADINNNDHVISFP